MNKSQFYSQPSEHNSKHERSGLDYRSNQFAPCMIVEFGPTPLRPLTWEFHKDPSSKIGHPFLGHTQLCLGPTRWLHAPLLHQDQAQAEDIRFGAPRRARVPALPGEDGN